MLDNIISEFEQHISELQQSLEPTETHYKIKVKKLRNTLSKLIEYRAQLRRDERYKDLFDSTKIRTV